MTDEEFSRIADLHGLKFIQALMTLEEERFAESRFLKGSTFEDINRDFGIFPVTRALPVYFAGDICNPENKVVVLGINPGFNNEKYQRELKYFDEHGLFKGCRRMYGEYFKAQGRTVRYYSLLGGFLRRLLKVDRKIDWDWFQENLITLEFIPYHSANVNGLRINDLAKFRRAYLGVLLKLLEHIKPKEPIYINSFPTVRKFLASNGHVLSEYADVFTFEEHDAVATGQFGGKFDFVGIRFLARPKGGVDAIVDEIQRRRRPAGA